MIWRDLALSRFGDHTGIRELEKIAETAGSTGRSELAMLASAFYCLAARTIRRTVPATFPKRIDPGLAPGLMALALSSLPAPDDAAEAGERAQTIEDLIHDCGGVQGDVLTIAAALSEPRSDFADEWIERHVRPLERFIAADEAAIFPLLSDEPLMQPLDCARCDGRCCYDGVYVTTAEEARIRSFMKEHPDYFRLVPDPFLEEGEWGFLFGGKRTLRRPYQYSRSDFPRHFTKTKCVFALDNGECSLQRAATDLWLHPWKYKPELCWEFPLIGLFNENAMSKPHYFGEPDPGYYDEEHPGYVSFLPCSRTGPGGRSWKKMYKTEFLHYFKTKGVGR